MVNVGDAVHGSVLFRRQSNHTLSSNDFILSPTFQWTCLEENSAIKRNNKITEASVYSSRRLPYLRLVEMISNVLCVFVF